MDAAMKAFASRPEPGKHDVNGLLQRLKREVFHLTPPAPGKPLPALAMRSEFQRCVRENPFVVVKGETGSGKSTQLPQYLADMPELSTLPIVCTQPRKVAAVSLATRVAFEFGAGGKGWTAEVGHLVGYKVGGQHKLTKHNRIQYVTEVTLLQELLDGRAGAMNWEAVGKQLSEKYSAVVVDEAHERSTNTDILLGLLRNAVQFGGARLKVVVTSATLDTKLFTAFFNCPLVEIPGRMFPVVVNYVPMINLDEAPNPSPQVVRCVLDILEDPDFTEGDILAFVTGQFEVETCVQLLQDQARRKGLADVDVMGLYGKQQPEDQAKVLQPATPGRRKVIFSTNVAETSVTIDGVRHVVDCGLCKENTYDQNRKMNLLETKAICRSSADQRKGRAGRTSSGFCHRLYAKDAYEQMQLSQCAEVLRSPLQLVMINLFQLGLEAICFPWIQEPDKDAMKQVATDLVFLDAVRVECGRHILTEFGKLCASLQMDPQLLRCVYEGARRGMASTACKLGGLLTVSTNVFWRGGSDDQKKDADDKKGRFVTKFGDVVAMLNVFKEWEEVGRTGGTRAGAADATPLEDGEMDGGLDAAALEKMEEHAAASKPEEEEEEEEGSNESAGISPTGNGPAQENEESNEVPAAAPSNAGPGLSYRQRAAKQRVWCRNNSINNKSLGIAESIRHDLQRALERANLWEDGNNNNCTDKDVQKMFLAGYFVNLANRHDNLQNFYAPYNSQMARLHSSSVVLYHDCPVTWVAYQQVMKTQHTFLQVITPIEHLDEWLHEVAKKFTDDQLGNLKQQQVDCKVITGIPKSAMRAMVGKGREAIQQLERDLMVSLSCEFENGILTVFGRQDKLQEAVAKLNTMADNFKAQLADEVHIETFAGKCRAVYGAGCVIQRFLLGDENLVAHFGNLPPQLTAEELADWIKEDTKNEVRVPKHRISLRTPARAAGVVSQLATVRLESPEEVTKVCALTDGTLFSHQVTILPAATEVKHGATTTAISGKVVLSWSTGKSKGKAHLSFGTHEWANSLIKRASKGFLLLKNSRDPNQGTSVYVKAKDSCKLWSPVLKAQVQIRYTLDNFQFSGDFQQWDPKSDKEVPSNARIAPCDIPFVVVVSGAGKGVPLPADWDEVDLEYAVARLLGRECIVQATLEREDMPEEGSRGFSDGADSSLLGQLAELRGIISGGALDDPDQPDLQTTVQLGKHRAGFILRYNSLAATTKCFAGVQERLRKRTQNGPKPVLYNEQSVRVHQEFTLSTSMHVALYDIFEHNFTVMVECWRRAGLRVTVKQPASRGPHARVSISIQAQDLPAVQHAEERVLQLVTGKLFEHDDSSVLFTRAGTLELQRVAQRLKGKAHIHWQAATRKIHVYGPDSGQHTALEALREAVKKLSNVKEESMPISGGIRAQRAVRRMLQKLRGEVKGIEAAHMQGSSLVVFGDSESRAEAAKRLREITVVASASAEALGPECPICLCEVEGRFVLQGCGHSACKDCLCDQLTGNPPFSCSTQGCNAMIVWSDIVALAKPTVLDLIKSSARKMIFAHNPFGYRRCSIANCEGVRQSPVTDQQFSCDTCGRTYCPTCTESTGKEQPANHMGTPCEDYQLKLGDRVKLLRREVEEALTPHRPCCGQPIVYGVWDGCAAVSCSKDCQGCGKNFCGACLDFCIVGDVHPHVRTCPENPEGGYFPKKQTYLVAHTKVIRQQLAHAMQQRRASKEEVRTILEEFCRAQLAELNLSVEAALTPP
eukprot:GGOE01031812.1.p1 GENE.GGOE01031812.1~~GGOE01031812.1.p1  ORF type:complete len:1855 (+),score=435.37 GGOE01031812.1:351-5567(+)